MKVRYFLLARSPVPSPATFSTTLWDLKQSPPAPVSTWLHSLPASDPCRCIVPRRLPLPLPPAEEEEEYRGDEDDADNEATIEEEEALAAAEGRDVKVGRLGRAAGRQWDASMCVCCCGMQDMSSSYCCCCCLVPSLTLACTSPHPPAPPPAPACCRCSWRRCRRWLAWMRRPSCRLRSCWPDMATTTWRRLELEGAARAMVGRMKRCQVGRGWDGLLCRLCLFCLLCLLRNGAGCAAVWGGGGRGWIIESTSAPADAPAGAAAVKAGEVEAEGEPEIKGAPPAAATAPALPLPCMQSCICQPSFSSFSLTPHQPPELRCPCPAPPRTACVLPCLPACPPFVSLQVPTWMSGWATPSPPWLSCSPRATHSTPRAYRQRWVGRRLVA